MPAGTPDWSWNKTANPATKLRYEFTYLIFITVPHRSQSPFHKRHRIFLGMVQRGVHFGNVWGGRLGLTVHICKVLQTGCPCLTGQSRFCLNQQAYGFTWPTLFKPLLQLVYPYYMDARYQLTGRHPGHGWPYGSACAWCILLTPLGLTPTWVLVLNRSTS